MLWQEKNVTPPHLLVICVCDDKNNGWTTCTDRTSSRLQKQTKQNKKPAFNSEHKPRKCNKRWVGVNEHYRTNRLKFSAKPQHKGSAWPQDWQLATNIVFSFHVTELYVKSIAHTLWDRKMTIKWNELVTAWKSGINNR